MKRRLLPAIALTALALGPLVPERADAAPTGYTIYCRGGQGLTELNVHPSVVILQKHILHGAEAYDPAALQPGTCAWPDRPMRADEPRRVMYGREVKGRDQITVRGNMQLGLWRVGRGVQVEQPLPSDLATINKLQSPNFIVELRVTSSTIRTKLRQGQPRDVKVLKVTEVGVARQIAQSQRG